MDDNVGVEKGRDGKEHTVDALLFFPWAANHERSTLLIMMMLMTDKVMRET